jgi:hypothetical protein
MPYNLIIFLLFLMLIISVINYQWLLNDVENKNYMYIKNLNQNKYKNINVVTYSYIYPKNWSVDKCYAENCTAKDNMFETKIKLFHDELYKLGDNKKILILKNDYNISPIALSTDDLNILSVMK